ncbi:MAG: ABC transporter permease, partial [Bifidobacteriaceae bacterium]|nr:ABC transporter permease [Bifidobacteriaceae bacterium]
MRRRRFRQGDVRAKVVKVGCSGRFQRRRDGFTVLDSVSHSVMGMSSRPGRLALTVLAVAWGIGSLVATIGFAQTGASQLDAVFDAVASTWVTVKPSDGSDGIADIGGADVTGGTGGAGDTDGVDMIGVTGVTGGIGGADGTAVSKSPIPWDAAERAERLNGVVRAATLTDISALVKDVTAVPFIDPVAVRRLQPNVVATSSGLLEAVAGQIEQGEFINGFHEQTAQPVAVLGRQAAKALGIHRVDTQPAIFVNEQPYAVIGVASGMLRHPELEDAVILPQSTARNQFALKSVSELLAQISLGSGPTVASQLPRALDPTGQIHYLISAPTTKENIKTQLTANVNTLFLALGIAATALGAITIAIVTSLSVIERRGEIGLRRALGATSRQIAALILTECAITGLLGGLIGTGS